MRIQQTYMQKVKAGLHFAQAFFIFIGGCLALAVLTQAGGTGAATGFYFALCFLTIPILVYQVMVPMWTRAWRFANVYAYAAIDIFSTILWFAAFVAVASWTGSGIRHGGDTPSGGMDQHSSGTCASFAYGSATKCGISRGSVGIGVILCLLFGVTSVLSVRDVFEYRRTGIMPNGNTRIHGRAEALATIEDPNKDPWSTNTDELDPNHPTNPFDDTQRASSDERLAYGQIPPEDDMNRSLLNDRTGHTNTSHDETGEELAHPGRALSLSSSTNLSVAPPPYDENLAPSALSPGGYVLSPGGRVSFPQGNYNEAFR